VLNALERMSSGYERELATARRELEIAQGQLKDYQARTDLPFAHEAYYRELTDLRDRLKAGLSATPPEGAEPPAAIAERIKTLKAAHSIDATAERPQARLRSAAEAVTTRIRRRTLPAPVIEEPQDEPQAAVPAAAPSVAAEPASPPPAPATVANLADWPAMPQPAYRPHAARTRHQNDRQLSLF
jgi:hypothetical protein